MSDPVVHAGTTVEFEYADSESPDGATFAWRLRGEGAYRRIVARRENGVWRASASATSTADWPVGAWEYQGVRKIGARTEVVETGRFQVLALAGDETRHAAKSFAERALACVEEVLIDYAGDGAVSVSVGDQSYSFETRNDLMAFRERLRSEIARSRAGVTASGFRW